MPNWNYRSLKLDPDSTVGGGSGPMARNYLLLRLDFLLGPFAFWWDTIVNNWLSVGFAIVVSLVLSCSFKC